MISVNLVTYDSNKTLIKLETNTMTKVEINTFLEKHKITFTNERVEIVLTKNQKIKI